MVNDGSTDDSERIINKFAEEYPNKIMYYYKENGGLSDARNYGIAKATGDYLCFVDSDDYIHEELFEKLEKYVDLEIDLIKFKCIKVDSQGKEIERIPGPIFECKVGEEAFNELYSSDILIEPAWLYLCKKRLFVENNLMFPVGKYHEDWAVMPYSIIAANKMSSVDFYGYYYVQSLDSITRNNNDEKIRARAFDLLEHYDKLSERLLQSGFSKTTIENFRIYMSNCIILKLEELPKKYHKEYIEQIKRRKIVNNFKVRNLKQLVKKLVIKINYKLYLKIR